MRTLIAMLVAGAACLVQAADPRPPVRVLFCIADDAAPHFGAYGCTWVKTPAIDRLAGEGVTFDRAYTPTAKCSPARAAILTGRYPWQLGAAANHNPFFPAEFKAFTEALADAGVAVGVAGKLGGPGVAQTADGADRPWVVGPPGSGQPSQAAARYREFLAGLPADKPAFFWFGSKHPHRPYARDAGLAAGKQPADIDRVPRYWPDNELVRRDMLDYATRVEAFDAEVAALLEVLAESGQADDTIVIVTSDHGMPFPRVKGHCFEAAHRVPLVVRVPAGRAAGGRRVSDFVNFVDFAPTFLELYGLTAETAGMRPITGRSLVDLVAGRPAADGPRDATLIGRERNDLQGRPGSPWGLGYPARGIRMGDHLYVRNFAPDRWPGCDPDLGLTDTDAGPTKQFIAAAGQLDKHWRLCFGLRPAEELYDVRQDPDCVKNLAGDPTQAAVLARLAERLLATLRDQEDPRVLGQGDAFDAYPSPGFPHRNRSPREAPDRDRDVVIYGGTSAAVVAAIRAALLGADVVIVSPDKHLGGLTSGGLGYTDSGNTRAIGGLAREFYRRVWRHYQQPGAWRWQPRETFRALGQDVKEADTADRSMWLFEPHVAERIFEQWLVEHGIEIVREARLDRERGVEMAPQAAGAGVNPRIRSITTLAGVGGLGRRFAGKVFIDATYEGDLMAAAGVGYHVGREANSVYGEEWNGNQVGILHHSHFFAQPVDPYRTPGDPASGLIPLVSADPPGTRGAGDTRVQAYCFRMCLTDHPENRVPFAKPRGYDPARYEVLARVLAAGWRDVFGKFDAIPNRKTDTNNHGPVSFDHIGANDDYPEASYERRREIIADHEAYQQGMLWFLSHDDRVPAEIRTRMRQWGLPKDEYGDTGHWSPQLYIREARRMIGADVLTEHECLGTRAVQRPIGMGSYTLDSHNVRRYVTPEGTVQNEGDIGVKCPRPYHIGYGSLVPKRGECANLLVPVCLSASHIAYGSARMEPVFMLLGDAAANAAVLAARAGIAVQDVDYPSLRGLLAAQGQVLDLP